MLGFVMHLYLADDFDNFKLSNFMRATHQICSLAYFNSFTNHVEVTILILVDWLSNNGRTFIQGFPLLPYGIFFRQCFEFWKKRKDISVSRVRFEFQITADRSRAYTAYQAFYTELENSSLLYRTLLWARRCITRL